MRAHLYHLLGTRREGGICSLAANVVPFKIGDVFVIPSLPPSAPFQMLRPENRQLPLGKLSKSLGSAQSGYKLLPAYAGP